MSQWRALKKGDDWDKGTPHYKVHCTDGVLDKGDDWDEDVPIYKVHCADGVLIKNGNLFDEVPQVQVFGEERGDAENRSNA